MIASRMKDMLQFWTSASVRFWNGIFHWFCFFPSMLLIQALWPWWCSGWQEEQNLEEPETNSRFWKGIAVATERS